MNAASSSQMLLAFWRQRDRESPWGRGLLIALTLLGVGACLYAAPGLWAAVLAGSATLALGGLWTVIAGSLLTQNHPHAARLVPGHPRQLRQAALTAWAALSLACALLLWAAFSRLPSFAALLLIAAATLAFTAWAMRAWTLWFVLSFGPALFFAFGLDRRLAPLWGALRELWAAQTVPVLTLCLLGLAWSITRLFGDGDAAHSAGYAARARMRRAAREGATGNRGGLAAFGRQGEWLGRPFERAASAWLRHVLARARPTPASVMQRAEIVLHGQQHWLRQALGMLVVLVIVALSLGIPFALSGLDKAWTHGAFGMAIGLVSAGVNPSFALPNMLWHSRREQALLQLLPGMPQGAAQNRAVAWLQLRHALLAWALTTLALAPLAWAAGDPALLCLAFGALPLSAASLLRTPATMRAPSSWTAVLPVFAFLLLAWGLYAAHQQLGLPMAVLAGISLAASLALGAWRWRAVCRAPRPLPAGRLS